MTLFRAFHLSPLGRLSLIACDDGLMAVLWPDDPPRRVPLANGVDAPDHPVLKETAAQLDAYFCLLYTSPSPRDS